VSVVITRVSVQIPTSMAASKPIVFVVDDDVSVREAIEVVITNAGWRPELFSSAHEFLARRRPISPSCLVLDVSLPDLNGLELQKKITEDHSELPIVFITGRGDIPMSVKAIKAGAVEFLTKPFAPEVLIESIRGALDRSREFLDREAALEKLRDRYKSLTGREREVMALVVQGRLNKQIGGTLGITEITVKGHRGQVMQKMRANSVPELVNMASRLGIETAGTTG
jgi:FixJ family two-component response regulator